MKDWTQPICQTCFHAWQLGREEPLRTPVSTISDPIDQCLICGSGTTIYVRIDPRLTADLLHAREKQES